MTCLPAGVARFLASVPRRASRFLFLLIASAWLVAQSVQAAEPAIDTAAGAYREGRVLDAVRVLENGIRSESDAARQWPLMTMLIDICVHAYQQKCLSANMTALMAAGEKIRRPEITAAKLMFVGLFERYLSGQAAAVVEAFGKDFAVGSADPLRDPVLATQLFLLNAKVLQQQGDFDGARRHINRGFASLLRVDAQAGSYLPAFLLKEIIAVTFDNNDIARGLHWLALADPLLQRTFAQQTFDYADYLLLLARSHAIAGDYDTSSKIYAQAERAFTQLQVDPVSKEFFLSDIAIASAANTLMAGDVLSARRRFETNPVAKRRENMMAAGSFAYFHEMYYAAAEIFFDALSGKKPDARWRGLFLKPASWSLGTSEQENESTYREIALALLEVEADPARGAQRFREAVKERLAFFEKEKSDTAAFPFPSVLDRVIVGLQMAAITSQGDTANGDLLLGGMELLNRNPRYVISDALAALAKQPDDTARRAKHAQIRLRDGQKSWETRELQEFVSRVSRREKPRQGFDAQFSARAYDSALQTLRSGARNDTVSLPRLVELQNTLGSAEAFVGFVAGLRVCVRKDRLWALPVPASTDRNQLKIDLKIIASSLTSQFAPDENLDSQFPAEAALRVHTAIFDGLAPCLAGAKHLIFFAPSDVAAIPVGVLLSELPPKRDKGYDLSRARWLARTYAVSQVTSIRDFLSSRALSSKASSDLPFAGIGNPHLAGLPAGSGASAETRSLRSLKPLPETERELTEVSAMFGKTSRILLDKEATEERFRALPLSRFQVLHFATHGLIRGEISGLSEAALVLTPTDMTDRVDDGLLTSSDIANLRLNAKLAVLSACNTANFDPLIFTGQIQGLASAFAVAGTPATIASLWPVESATSERLMRNFYRHFLANETAASALQRAMLETIDAAPERAFYHPRFWAPFILLGDGGVSLSPKTESAGADMIVDIGSGEEVIGLASGDFQMITSEIGPRYQGTHSSVLRGRDRSGLSSWSVEDREIGAGKIIALDGKFVTAGYRNEGRTVPLLRAISRKGEALWSLELAQNAGNHVISALSAGGKNDFFALLQPVGAAASPFGIVKADGAGKANGRVSFALKQDAVPGIGTATMLVNGGFLYVALNLAASKTRVYRNDFGFPSSCAEGAGAQLYKFRTSDLVTEEERFLPAIHVHRISASPEALFFAGSEYGTCTQDGQKPILGRLSEDLAASIVWRDESPFSGRLAGLIASEKNLLAVAEIAAPLDIAQRQTEAGTETAEEIWNKKHPDILNDTAQEAVLMSFTNAGAPINKTFLGNGLPQFVMGLEPRDNGAVVYGSNGFNPWLAFGP